MLGEMDYKNGFIKPQEEEFFL